MLRQRHVRPTGLSSQVSSRRGWVTGPPLALLSERPLPLLRVLRLPFETVAGSLIVAIASSSVIPLEEGSAALFSSQVKGPTLVLRRAAGLRKLRVPLEWRACERACVQRKSDRLTLTCRSNGGDIWRSRFETVAGNSPNMFCSEGPSNEGATPGRTAP